jgi:hypothetical protein
MSDHRAMVSVTSVAGDDLVSKSPARFGRVLVLDLTQTARWAHIEFRYPTIAVCVKAHQVLDHTIHGAERSEGQFR